MHMVKAPVATSASFAVLISFSFQVLVNCTGELLVVVPKASGGKQGKPPEMVGTKAGSGERGVGAQG
jgi:hypothetical protein